LFPFLIELDNTKGPLETERNLLILFLSFLQLYKSTLLITLSNLFVFIEDDESDAVDEDDDDDDGDKPFSSI